MESKTPVTGIAVLSATDDAVAVRKPGGERATISWPSLREAASQDDAELATIYRGLLRRAEAIRDRERQARMDRCSGHEAVSTSDPWPFSGPVNPRDENRAAHGGIGVTETCRCGAERSTLINGLHTETGRWL